jgi:hypothetical protein
VSPHKINVAFSPAQRRQTLEKNLDKEQPREAARQKEYQAFVTSLIRSANALLR